MIKECAIILQSIKNPCILIRIALILWSNKYIKLGISIADRRARCLTAILTSEK